MGFRPSVSAAVWSKDPAARAYEASRVFDADLAGHLDGAPSLIAMLWSPAIEPLESQVATLRWLSRH
jgi:hypothetical protein